MYIKSISFEIKSDEINWEIDNLEFNKINLISGKNASGKTRVLSSIITLIYLMRGGSDIGVEGFSWSIKLIENKIEYIYDLKIKNQLILHEELKIDNKVYFSRNEEGKGKIKYETKKGLNLDFEIEKNKIILAFRRDKIQHPSLEVIFNCINSLYKFNFGDTLGKYTSYTIKNGQNNNDTDVVYKFKKGVEKFGDKFKEKIIQEFNALDYNISDIFLKEIVDNSLVLVIKENTNDIEQQFISQGMFRALSLIIQITYLEFRKNEQTIVLIDDIGEGLDFERANNLIKYLIKNAEGQKERLQLIMTTNDRLVMNNVPLDYWIIVDKDEKGKINFYSQKTHPKNFENFEDIGLNNFDFFSGEYYKNCVWGD